MMELIEKNRSAPLRPREREILEAHPLFFRAIVDPAPYRAPVGYWGLVIGDGRLEIVNEAADEIEAAIEADVAAFDFRTHLNLLDREQLQYVPPLDEEQGKASEPTPAFLYCTQVKEKFGDLEIYVRRGAFTSDECMQRVRDAIAKAQEKAGSICENCGAPGRQIKERWWRVACEACKSGKVLDRLSI